MPKGPVTKSAMTKSLSPSKMWVLKKQFITSNTSETNITITASTAIQPASLLLPSLRHATQQLAVANMNILVTSSPISQAGSWTDTSYFCYQCKVISCIFLTKYLCKGNHYKPYKIYYNLHNFRPPFKKMFENQKKK